jgi:hypothetical protein
MAAAARFSLEGMRCSFQCLQALLGEAVRVTGHHLHRLSTKARVDGAFSPCDQHYSTPAWHAFAARRVIVLLASHQEQEESAPLARGWIQHTAWLSKYQVETGCDSINAGNERGQQFAVLEKESGVHCNARSNTTAHCLTSREFTRQAKSAIKASQPGDRPSLVWELRRTLSMRQNHASHRVLFLVTECTAVRWPEVSVIVPLPLEHRVWALRSPSGP